VFNLGVKDKYDEALRQLGYDLETLAEQVRGGAAGPLKNPSLLLCASRLLEPLS
jgi:hypothetical protein